MRKHRHARFGFDARDEALAAARHDHVDAAVHARQHQADRRAVARRHQRDRGLGQARFAQDPAPGIHGWRGRSGNCRSRRAGSRHCRISGTARRHRPRHWDGSRRSRRSRRAAPARARSSCRSAAASSRSRRRRDRQCRARWRRHRPSHRRAPGVSVRRSRKAEVAPPAVTSATSSALAARIFAALARIARSIASSAAFFCSGGASASTRAAARAPLTSSVIRVGQVGGAVDGFQGGRHGSVFQGLWQLRPSPSTEITVLRGAEPAWLRARAGGGGRVGLVQRAGRSIGNNWGDDPAWIVPSTSKPCR